MRWIMIAVTAFGLALSWLATSPGWLGVGLLLTLVGLFGTVFAIAAARIETIRRPDNAMLSIEDQVTLHKRGHAAPPGNSPPGDRP